MRQLINELSKLPSIGERSAFRLAYHLLTTDKVATEMLSDAIRSASEKTRLCEICFMLTEESVCGACCDNTRERSIICVVEKPADVMAIEKSGAYSGLYHVLHGVWAPLKGVKPEQTKIKELLKRIKQAASGVDSLFPPVKELVLATSTTVEGDATAMYIAEYIAEFEIKLSRIAQGLPKGGELEYADEVTLNHALFGRQNMRT